MKAKKSRTLAKPAVKTGGGGSGYFRIEKDRHALRVFPFLHDDEPTLAAVDVIHFMPDGPSMPCEGDGCRHCQEAKQSKNKRLRASTRYPMYVVDVEDDPEVVMIFDAPSSIYRDVYSACEEAGDEWESLLGNSGQDFIIKRNKKGGAAGYYMTTLRPKASVILEIDDDELEDLVTLVEERREASGGGDDSDDSGTTLDDDENIVYYRKGDKVIKATDTGTRRNGKWVLEVDGRLVQVSPSTIVTEDEEDEEDEESASTGAAGEELVIGDAVTFDTEEEGVLTGVITGIVDENADVLVDDEDVWEIALAELTKVESVEEEQEDTISEGDSVSFAVGDDEFCGVVNVIRGEIADVEVEGEEWEVGIAELTKVEG